MTCTWETLRMEHLVVLEFDDCSVMSKEAMLQSHVVILINVNF